MYSKIIYVRTTVHGCTLYEDCYYTNCFIYQSLSKLTVTMCSMLAITLGC